MRDGLRRAVAETLGEPALHVRVDQFGQTFFLYELDAVVPRPLVGVMVIRVREDELLDAVGSIRSQPLADHAAHRQAAPVEFFDLECIGDGEHVAPEALHRIGAFRCVRLAVAAAVIANDTEMLRPFRRLVVPHVQIGAERIGQHQHRGAIATLDLDIECTAVIGFDHRHEFFLPAWILVVRRGVDRHP